MSGYRAEIENFLRSKGLSPQAVAGIMGNWMVESSFNPSAVNQHEGAIGFAQWEGGRREALRQWALTHHGAQEDDAQSQLEFFWHELTTSYPQVLQQLRTARTAADAAAIFDEHYEVSSGSTRQQRVNYASQFYTGGGPNPNYTGESAANAGAGTAGTGSGSQQMSASDYSNVDSLGSLLSSIPELRALVDKAVASNWTPDKFQNAVEDSKWWKQHSETARSAIIQRANDPASYNQQITNTQNSITSLAHQLGMPLSAAELHSIATSALLSGNDGNQQWLTQQISHHENYSKITDTGSLTGGMANTVQQLSALGAEYGFTWSPSEIAQRAQNILDGSTTIDTYRQRLIKWASSTFPSLAKDIQSGTTVKDLADPYIQSMSQLLEVDPASLNTYTPLIRQAMQGTRTDPKQEPTAMPLWQFEKQVKNDPRWQYTQNAKDTMSTALVKIGADFGFGPNG